MRNNKITVYIEKDSVYFDPQTQQYRAYVRDSAAYLEAGRTYYAYEITLPIEEIARFEHQEDAVEQVDSVTGDV